MPTMVLFSRARKAEGTASGMAVQPWVSCGNRSGVRGVHASSEQPLKTCCIFIEVGEIEVAVETKGFSASTGCVGNVN